MKTITIEDVEKKSKINSENSVDLSEKINLDGGIGIGRDRTGRRLTVENRARKTG